MTTTRQAAPTAPSPLMTAAELLALPDDDYRYELVRGKLIRMPPPGSLHGRAVARVTIRLGQFVETHNLGAILNESGYHLESVQIRCARQMSPSFQRSGFLLTIFRRTTLR